MNMLGKLLYTHLRNWLYRKTQKPILNRLRQWRGRHVRSLKFPEDFYLWIGTTNICNARCSFCIYPKVVDNRSIPLGTMKEEVYRAVIDEWSLAGGNRIHFCSSVGDPLMDPNIGPRIRYAKAKGLKAIVITNGISMNQRGHIRDLVEAHEVFISTQGTDPQAYREVYGVDKYAQFMDGLEEFLSYNRLIGEPARVRIGFRNKQSIGQILRSKDFIHRIDPFLSSRVTCDFIAQYESWSGQITASDCPGPMTKLSLLRAPCEGTRNLSVKFDGKVHACGCLFLEQKPDDLLLGLFPDQSLRQIASSVQSYRFFNSFKTGQLFQTCSQCTNYTPIHPVDKIF